MYLIDYHVHTKRCRHAAGEDREYVEAAIGKGLREIGFSDHVPRFYEPPDGEKVTERGMGWADLDGYVTSISKLRSEYGEILIKLGLEVDYVPGWERRVEEIAGRYPWDFLIGSVHFNPAWNYGYIGYEKEHEPAEIFFAYFSLVARMAESGLFDILGHIDLPKRFFKVPPEKLMEDLYQDLAVRLGKENSIIELNTYAIRNSKQGDMGIIPDPYLLRFCREQGIKVTIGSDAHKPEEVGADFHRVRETLALVGYDRITTFQRRKPALVEWGR